MPVPGFTIDGVLPPFLGLEPVEAADQMTPYVVTPADVVAALGTTANRRDILGKWFAHRHELRELGFSGFQWLDGSFLEDKEPADLDLVIFYEPPAGMPLPDLIALANANANLFAHAAVKAQFRLDAYFLRLDGDPTFLVQGAAYYLGLFSHQRVTSIWKGMLLTRFDDVAMDAAAVQLLNDLEPEPA